MYKTLSPATVGVKVIDLQEGLTAAKIGNFQGLEFSVVEAADQVDRIGADGVKKQFDHAQMRPAAFGLPTDWRGSESKWQDDLKKLPRLAKAAAAIGCTRTFTWIMPGSNDLAPDANRAFHIGRFEPIARILGDSGIALGLEFIGPKTLRDSLKHPFIYRMDEMLALGKEIGPNVGLLLDCWHWYTSGGTIDELRALKPQEVVYVHVNDAPAGVHVDQQIDSVRLLPGESGVIDIKGFLQALKSINYDGPVTPEPFKKDLANLPSDEARLKAAGAAMTQVFNAAGI